MSNATNRGTIHIDQGFFPPEKGEPVAKRPNDEKLLQIEQNQAALRKSIEKTKELAADSDRLIRRHRHEPKPPNPA